MTELSNRQFKLVSRPIGAVKRGDFEFTSTPVVEPSADEVLVEMQYISLDPAMRGWMRDAPSYMPPVALGAVMRAIGLGRVIASNDARLQVGDTVTGMTGVQDYTVAKADRFTKIDSPSAPLPRYIGALGMPGMTAYFGLLDVGRPKAGETVVVSAAAGAVGSIVGQIAKLKGCRVVGIAGGPAKCRYLTEEVGFDAAIDYKSEAPILANVGEALKQHCPHGLNVFFDNVGGDMLDAALANLALKARVVICGGISQYNATGAPQGPRYYLSLLVNRARMEGFLVTDYAARYGEAIREMTGWLAESKLKAREDVVDGLESFPETLLKLFSGENFGKLVLKVR